MTQKLNISDLSLEEVNAILVVLQELPAKICNPLSEKIRKQVVPQLEQPKEPRTINHSIDEGVATADRLG